MPHLLSGGTAEPRPPKDPLPLEGAAIRGNRSATVAIVEYSDFKCPACGQFATGTLPAIERRYVDTGKVLLAFRQYPMDRRPLAQKAAEAAICAGDQGKFWEMHDQLFAHQGRLEETSLR